MPDVTSYARARTSRISGAVSQTANILGSLASAFLESEINNQYRNARAQALKDISDWNTQLQDPKNARAYATWGEEWKKFAEQKKTEIADSIKLGEARRRFEADWTEFDIKQSETVASWARGRQQEVNVSDLNTRLQTYQQEGRWEEIGKELDSAVQSGTISGSQAATAKVEMTHKAQYNLARKELTAIAQNQGYDGVLALLAKPELKYLDLDNDDRTNLLREFTNMKNVDEALKSEQRVKADQEAMSEMTDYVISGEYGKLNPNDERLSTASRLTVSDWAQTAAAEQQKQHEARLLKSTLDTMDVRFRSGELTEAELDSRRITEIVPLEEREKYRSKIQARDATAAKAAQAEKWTQNELTLREKIETTPAKVSPKDIIAAGRQGDIDPEHVSTLLDKRRQLIPGDAGDPEDKMQFDLEWAIRKGELKTDDEIAGRVRDLGFAKPDSALDEALTYRDKVAEEVKKVEYARAQQSTYDYWGDMFDDALLTTDEIERRATVENAAREGVIPEDVQEQWKEKVRRQEAEKRTKEDNSRLCAEIVYDFTTAPEVRNQKLRDLFTQKKINGDELAQWLPRIKAETDQQAEIIKVIQQAYQASMQNEQNPQKQRELGLKMVRALESMEQFFRDNPGPESYTKWITQRDSFLQDKSDEELMSITPPLVGTTAAPQFATGERRKGFQEATIQKALLDRGKLPPVLAAKFKVEMSDEVHLLAMDAMENAGLVRKNLFGKVTTKYHSHPLPSGDTLYSVGQPIEFDENGNVILNDSMYVVKCPMIDGVYTPEVYKWTVGQDENGNPAVTSVLYHRYGEKR